MSADFIWIVWLGLFVVLEGYGLVSKQDGDTLSERTREWFKTEKSAAGRRAFAVGWATFSGWFLWHILWQHPVGPLP